MCVCVCVCVCVVPCAYLEYASIGNLATRASTLRCSILALAIGTEVWAPAKRGDDGEKTRGGTQSRQNYREAAHWTTPLSFGRFILNTSDVKPLSGTFCTITPDHLGTLTAISSAGAVRLQFQLFESTRPISRTYSGHSLRSFRLTALVLAAGVPLTHLNNTVKELCRRWMCQPPSRAACGAS
jgi:hypothetical protein